MENQKKENTDKPVPKKQSAGFLYEVRKENIRHGEAGFPCAGYLDRYQNSEDSFPWHWHDELEIAWVTQGSVTVFIHAHSFELHEGEGVFINRRIPHSYSGTDAGPAQMPNVLFRPALVYGTQESVYWEKYLKPLLLASSFSHVVLTGEETWQTGLLSHAKRVFLLLTEKPFGYEFHVRSALSEILLLLAQNMAKATDAADGSLLRQADMDRIRLMLSFIQEHYTEPLQVRQIAASAFLSRRECLRCFQRTIGTSPMQYTIELRVQKARKLLLETDLPLLDICTECGFQDQSYFIKTFRERTGISPARFRKRSGMTAAASPSSIREPGGLRF